MRSNRPKIEYGFAALPHEVVRGGHGAVNIAVLAALISHGRTTASAATIAREVGCDRKSVFHAVSYWTERGPAAGVLVSAENAIGRPTIYQVEIRQTKNKGHPDTSTENGTGTKKEKKADVYRKRNRLVQEGKSRPVPKTVQVPNGTRTENGTPPVPKTARPPVPKTVHKEEQEKKNTEVNKNPLPLSGEAATEKLIAQVIEVFVKAGNATLKYDNKTQRRAARELIQNPDIGPEKVLQAARFACKLQGQRFQPQVFTPYDLVQKYAAVQAAVRALAQGRTTGGIAVIS